MKIIKQNTNLHINRLLNMTIIIIIIIKYIWLIEKIFLYIRT